MSVVDMDVYIGAWVRRTDRRSRKAHKVESVIAGDAVTTCGRRMRDDESPLEVHHGAVSRANRPLDWDLCKGCV